MVLNYINNDNIILLRNKVIKRWKTGKICWVALDLILTCIKQLIKEVVGGDVIVFFFFCWSWRPKVEEEVEKQLKIYGKIQCIQNETQHY